MKTLEELLEKFASDRAFRDDVMGKLEATGDAGLADPAATFVEVAAELGYEVSIQQATALLMPATDNMVAIPDGELDAVAGGTYMPGDDEDSRTGKPWENILKPWTRIGI